MDTPLSGDLASDVAAIQRIAAVPSILEVLCQVTGMRLAAIARVTEDQWVSCAVRDEIDYGFQAGQQLAIHTTLCDEIRGHQTPIIIGHVDEDPIFHDHHTPRTYGFQSYISVPIIRGNGDFFGTLFAIDPAPAKLANSSAATTFNLFAQLIALQLDADERLAAEQA